MFVERGKIGVKGEYGLEGGGLWEMKKDGMGGGLVWDVGVEGENGGVMVVEGFVYNGGKVKGEEIGKVKGGLYRVKVG